MSHEKRVVIVDNGSRHPEAVSYLERLTDRYTVYRMPDIHDVPVLPGDWEAHGGHPMQAVQRNLSEAFRLELEAGNSSAWFGVTDADVHLDGSPDSLDAYMELATEIDYAVGPHLRLNAHRNYPLRSAAILQHARLLFRDRMTWLGSIPYTIDPIDTTFHLFPASESFRRLEMDTVRVGPPWMATHSDWVIDFCNPTTENFAYILEAGEAASWGGRWIRDYFAAFLRSPEEAFALIEHSEKVHDDYFYPWFMLSWALQYGHGCDIDLDRSRAMLRRAIPGWSPLLEFERHWDAIVYEDDLSCLGWP